ncbi:MAG TPA: glycosyltransferase [Streptosporangiaceae bacterium]|nr:glycosyltransferase [Streptosporangiaceae bacterium]
MTDGGGDGFGGGFGGAERTRLWAAQARADRHGERLNRLVGEVSAARRRIRELEERLAAADYRADRLSWQLESVRAGRWWRLGQALAAAQRHPIGLPGGLLRALEGRPRPEPPVRTTGRRTENPAGDARSFLEVAPVPLPDGPVHLPDLTVAVVHDVATTIGLRYEWRQLDGFGPDDWRPVFERERPRLLFAGPAPGWSAAALEPLVAWCRERHIPTVYWLVGDDPPEDAHDEAARLFDHVYVADARAVPRYRDVRGDDRVDVLPVAAQPRVHNPIGVPERGAFDIAGPPGALVDGMRELGPHVYGPVGTPMPRPGCLLLGDLPYEATLAARKLYKVVAGGGPREIVELAAAGIPAISRLSDHVRDVFGDLVPRAVNHREAGQLARLLLASTELRDRNAHLAWRAVFEGHTYRHRVAAVLRGLGIGPAAPPPEPPVSVVLATCRTANIDHAIEQVARQTWRPVQLIIVLHGLDVEAGAVERQAKAAGIDDVVVLCVDGARTLGACLNAGIEAADGAFIGKMDDDELYGPRYLADLLHAFDYTEAGIVGKLAHYVHLSGSGANILRYPELEHSYVDLVRGGALLARGDLLRTYRFDDVTRGEDTRLFRRCRADGVKIYSADRFSFVMVRHHDPARHTWQVSDRALMADGRIVFYGPPHEHVLI